MIKRAVACGVGAAFSAAALLVPANVSARSFAFPHPGLHRGHQHAYWPYGYGGLVATYTPNDYAAPVIVVPTSVTPAVLTPDVPVRQCVHSRETITVPAEGGGERQVTITRC